MNPELFEQLIQSLEQMNALIDRAKNSIGTTEIGLVAGSSLQSLKELQSKETI